VGDLEDSRRGSLPEPLDAAHGLRVACGERLGGVHEGRKRGAEGVHVLRHHRRSAVEARPVLVVAEVEKRSELMLFDLGGALGREEAVVAAQHLLTGGDDGALLIRQRAGQCLVDTFGGALEGLGHGGDGWA
jgi:hypothetical protein